MDFEKEDSEGLDEWLPFGYCITILFTNLFQHNGSNCFVSPFADKCHKIS